jgi:hypothetical protein
MPASSDLKTKILSRMKRQAPFGVWTTKDFGRLGTRNAIDLTLSRLAKSGEIRRITRGLYDLPRTNQLTGNPTNSDPRQVIEALARREPARMLIDGLTAANDLGFTTAVPAKIIVHTDARLRPIRLGNQTIVFKPTAPTKLFWAGRPAMRLVQALHWLRDTLERDREAVEKRLRAILDNPEQGPTLIQDLRKGAHTLPEWMQAFLTFVLASPQKTKRGRARK